MAVLFNTYSLFGHDVAVMVHSNIRMRALLKLLAYMGLLLGPLRDSQGTQSLLWRVRIRTTLDTTRKDN